jgi:hypothetical protein
MKALFSRNRIPAMFMMVLAPHVFLLSQENDIRINTDWDHERFAWSSFWIGHPQSSRTGYGVVHLRNPWNWKRSRMN